MTNDDLFAPGFSELPESKKQELFDSAAKAVHGTGERLGRPLTQMEGNLFASGWIAASVATLEFCRAEQEGG